MSELFSEVASIDYPIIDSDAHVNEPPDLWQERVPARLKNCAPKVIHTADGDVWSFDDGKKLRPVGLTATAGLSYLQFKPSGYRYESIRPGSFDTAERLKDLDADGLYAQILYPSVTLAGARTYSDDRELQTACVRAYNEWLLDFCKPSGDRPLELGGRVGSFSDAGLQPTLVQSTLGFLAAAGGSKSGADSIGATLRVMFSGACDEFPKLRFVIVEGNIGWIPTVMET